MGTCPKPLWGGGCACIPPSIGDRCFNACPGQQLTAVAGEGSCAKEEEEDGDDEDSWKGK